jgi:hypothetical protein
MNYDAILGLPNTKTFDDAGATFNIHRRRMLKVFPRGGCTLTGLLSMLKSEPVTDPTFTNYPLHWKFKRTTTRGTAPLTTTAPSTGDVNDGTGVGTATVAIATTYYLKVASTFDHVVGSIVQLGTAVGAPQFRVKAITRGVATAALLGYLTLAPIRAFSHTLAGYPTGLTLELRGHSAGEGASGSGWTNAGQRLPCTVVNNTQIFRHSKTFTGTALKQGTKYDETSSYKEQMQELSLTHNLAIESQLYWGQRSVRETTSQDSNQSDNLVYRTFGGIEEHLRLWDAGTTGLEVNGATYAPYSHKGETTSDSDFDKRMIANTAGTFAYSDFNDWMERGFRFSSSPKNGDRMAFLGGGAMNAFNDMLRKTGNLNLSIGDEAYGFKFNTLHTQWGSLHFTDHPLFSENGSPDRYSMLILDPHALRLRPMVDRDTRIRASIQNPGDDFRRDEFHSELGLEVLGVESMLWVKNLQQFILD